MKKSKVQNNIILFVLLILLGANVIFFISETSELQSDSARAAIGKIASIYSNEPKSNQTEDQTSVAKLETHAVKPTFREQLKAFYKDIVLVIHYNGGQNFRRNLLNGLKPYFHDIVITTGTPLLEKEFPWILCGEVATQYYCVNHVMELYPDARGYLVIHFDVFPNIWNFINYDKDQPWGNFWVWHDFDSNHEWMCWQNSKDGIRRIYENPEWLQIAEYNCSNYVKNPGNGKWRAATGLADIFYVPGKWRDRFKQQSKLWKDHGVFLEIGWPTFMHCVSPEKGPQMLVGLVEHKNEYSFSCLYNLKHDFVHAVQYLNEFHVQKADYLLSQIDNSTFISGEVPPEWKRC